MNRFAFFGCVMLVLGGLGHLVLVDICGLQYETRFVTWGPESPLEDLKRTTMDFEPLGATNAFRAFSGFSVWVALSLFFLGSQGILVYRFSEPGSILRVITWCVYFLISIVFFFIAFTCFIYPATIGATIAAALFALAIRKEKSLK